MKTEYQYIHFAKTAEKPKTVVYECRNNRSGEVLGEVKWYGPWRQYCFHVAGGAPYTTAIFNVGCMKDICDFIEQLPRKTSRKKD